jgi:hypothetical protein
VMSRTGVFCSACIPTFAGVISKARALANGPRNLPPVPISGGCSCASLPSMPRPPDRKLLSYLATYDPHVSNLTLALRDVVLEEAPEAIESIVKGYALAIGFSFTGKPLKDGFCHVVTYSSHVNLGFNRGAHLPDPSRVLAGKGKSIRHITIRNQSELDRPCIRRYLQAAIEQVGDPPHPKSQLRGTRR